MTWAIYTNHTWEDYYITYRASKNLATGHGLTFTQGERVHSFTSPLGVLLPALAPVFKGDAGASVLALAWPVGLTLAGREDWRRLPLITIDPADAKDHDDAVHAASDPGPDNPGGFVVTVAIADVQSTELSATSLMPEGLLEAFSPEQRRNLVAYLMSKAQVPLPVK